MNGDPVPVDTASGLVPVTLPAPPAAGVGVKWKVRSSAKALAFSELQLRRPDLSFGQAGTLVDAAADLLGRGEAEAAVDLLSVAVDAGHARRLVHTLASGR